jgi:hypothetical protein
MMIYMNAILVKIKAYPAVLISLYCQHIDNDKLTYSKLLHMYDRTSLRLNTNSTKELGRAG